MTCPNEQKNNQICNCTYSGCSRHGVCCECLHYHRKRGELPACYFNEKQEKTWDRSIEYYYKNNVNS